MAKVRQIIGSAAEKKEVLTVLSNTFNATQSFVTLCTSVPTGTDYNTRVGRSANHMYIEVNLVVTMEADVTSTDATYGDAGFWAIVFDRQPNGSTPAFSDIYDVSNGNPPGTAFRSTFNYQDRFKVLANENWQAGSVVKGVAVTGGGTGTAPYRCSRFVDLSRLKGQDGKIKFSGSGSGISNIDEGAIFFVFASTFSTSTQTGKYTGMAKWRFVDL